MKSASKANVAKFVRLAVLITLCLGVGVLSSMATMSGIRDWYAQIAKPRFNPPDWVFGPVWSILYILMGITAAETWECRLARQIFFITLLANALWSLFFFGFHRPDFALLDVLAYTALLVLWIRQLWIQHRSYAVLQIPHLLWVSFATLLNACIWHLN